MKPQIAKSLGLPRRVMIMALSNSGDEGGGLFVETLFFD